MAERKVAVFDIDGTIADDTWRRGNAAIVRYHALAPMDKPMNIKLIQKQIDSGRDIWFVTGRPEKFRDATEKWLQKNTPVDTSTSRLLMRSEDDTRSSPELKVALIRDEIDELAGRAVDITIVTAFDDRADVLLAYQEAFYGVDTQQVNVAQPETNVGVAETLRAMATTFDERNKVYGNNYALVAPVMRALFPGGVPAELPLAVHWHLFELIIVKLTRFAMSGLTHEDSIHDTAIYAAMIETILKGEQK